MDAKNNGKTKKKLYFFSFVVFFYSSLAGCSRPTQEKVLRIFFDGVPPPSEETAVIKTEDIETAREEIKTKRPQPQKSTSYFHPPFLENQCDSCHESKFSQKLVSKGSELCFVCHDDFTKNNTVVHYPVSEGACIECHDPHQSPHQFILKNKIPELCFSCHEESEIRLNPMHEDQALCTQCHSAHASNEEKLLK